MEKSTHNDLDTGAVSLSIHLHTTLSSPGSSSSSTIFPSANICIIVFLGSVLLFRLIFFLGHQFFNQKSRTTSYFVLLSQVCLSGRFRMNHCLKQFKTVTAKFTTIPYFSQLASSGLLLESLDAQVWTSAFLHITHTHIVLPATCLHS